MILCSRVVGLTYELNDETEGGFGVPIKPIHYTIVPV